jgi:hypothetical protein
LVQAVLFEELVQGDARDAHREGSIDKVDQIGACGVGVAQEEASNGSGVTGQEFAVGSAIHTVVGLLDGLLGGEFLLFGGGGPAEAEQARQGGDLQAAAAVEQEMAQQARGVVILALVLAKAESSAEEAKLIGGQGCFADRCLCEPLAEGAG